MNAIHRSLLTLSPPFSSERSRPEAAISKQRCSKAPPRRSMPRSRGSHRSDANKARDRYRHPKETLEFFGLRPEMTVVEIWPGGGWYTEVLAPVLRERGKLYAAQYGSRPPFPYQQREMETLAGKIARAPAISTERHADGASTSPERARDRAAGSADLVVTFRNVHNWFQEGYGPPNAAELAFNAMFTALKPGGVLGVVDHRWPDPATEDPRARNGYVSEQRVIALAEAAGFELAGRSDVNRNPLDTHDYPEGRLDAAARSRARRARPRQVSRDRRVGPPHVEVREARLAAATT